MSTRSARVAPLLLGSGACALVYQVAWQREFRLIFGGSTAASAAVLAIFIGGLGVGGLLLGRRADAHARPLRLYAGLEAGIALTAALSPLLLETARAAYVAAGGTAALGPAGAGLVRLLLSALVLLVPCVLMGGTLPAAARAVEREDDAPRRDVALLYGVNTLGSVAGALLATFLLIETFGTRASLWLACALNLVIAAAAAWLARETQPALVAASPAATAPEPPAAEAPPAAPPAFVLFAAGAVGFLFFLMEIVWYRMLTPLLGGTVFTFGLILAVALLGIGAGGILYSALGRGRPPTLAGFSLTCLAEAGALAVPWVLGDRVALLALRLQSWGLEAGFPGLVGGWAVVTSLVVLPAAVAAGAQFPLLVALLGRGRRDVGRHVGLAYAANTAGAVAGSLAGGFGLLPLLTAPGCWVLASLMLVLLGVAAGSHRARQRGLKALLGAPLAAGLILGALFGSDGPTAAWRHSGIGVGRAQARVLRSASATRAFVNTERRAVVWEAEGTESSVAMLGRHGLAFTINGKVDGNARGDAPTMIMSGLVGVLRHPRPERALVVGLGTGSTAGWLAAVPSIARVDVLELEPRVADVARACAPVNHGALASPRVSVRFGDAREGLLVSRERYDLIVSEPSNPYRAGVSSLFTREFYAAVANRLGEGGLFLQWLQAYEVDAATVATVYATLGSVFPDVETWQVGRFDMLLVAGRRAPGWSAAELRERLAAEPLRGGVAFTWRVAGLEGALARYVGGPRLARAVAGRAPALNTDDRNRVEFGFARTLGMEGLFAVADLRREARALGDALPALPGASVDRARVEYERALISVAAGAPLEIPPGLSAEHRERAEAIGLWAAGRPAEALAAWRARPREPSGPLEIAVVAEMLAQAATDEALPYVEALRAYQPAEADAILGRLRLRQGRLDEAGAAIEAALGRYRDDPQPAVEIMSRALAVAQDIAGSSDALARRMLAALREPFAVRMINEPRERTLLAVADRLPMREACLLAVSPLEPWVPWRPHVLLYRRNCYAETGDPRLARAEAELAELLREDIEEPESNGFTPVPPLARPPS